MINTADKKSFDQRFALVRTLDAGKLVTDSDAATLTLMDAEKGNFFTYLEKTYFITEKNVYQEMSEDYATPQDYTLTELTCLCIETGATAHFEWEYDDELEVSVTQDRLNFKKLTDDGGQPIDGDDLDQIVDDEDCILYAGQKFHYEDDWAAVYKRGNKEEKVYMYEFENEAGSQSLTIEEWKGTSKDAYQIYISTPIIPRDITIIAKGGPVNETTTP